MPTGVPFPARELSRGSRRYFKTRLWTNLGLENKGFDSSTEGFETTSTGLTTLILSVQLPGISSEEAVELYRRLRDQDELSCRVFINMTVDAQAPLEEIEAKIQAAARDPLHSHSDMLWLRGVKVFLDGGMLTGSAYLRQPWGVSKIYSIEDPQYRVSAIHIPKNGL